MISFGDSSQYKLPFEDSKEALEKSAQLVALEHELRDYLNDKLPESNVTYYVTPKVVEVEPGDAEKYASYPVLDAAAVADIKKRLLKGVQDMNSLKELNRNAPFDDLNESAL